MNDIVCKVLQSGELPCARDEDRYEEETGRKICSDYQIVGICAAGSGMNAVE